MVGRLDLDHDNLRAALDDCLEDPDPKPGFRLIGALGWYWLYRDHAFAEIDRVAQIVDRPESQTPTPTRARALAALARLVQTTTFDDARTAIRAREAVDLTATGRSRCCDRRRPAPPHRRRYGCELSAAIEGPRHSSGSSTKGRRHLPGCSGTTTKGNLYALTYGLGGHAADLDPAQLERSLVDLREARALWVTVGDRFEGPGARQLGSLGSSHR